MLAKAADYRPYDLADGNWHFITATFKRNGKVTYYVDGKRVKRKHMKYPVTINGVKP